MKKLLVVVIVVIGLGILAWFLPIIPINKNLDFKTGKDLYNEKYNLTYDKCTLKGQIVYFLHDNKLPQPDMGASVYDADYKEIGFCGGITGGCFINHKGSEWPKCDNN